MRQRARVDVAYHERPPLLALSRHVQKLWALRVRGDGPQIITPDGSAEIVIHCGARAIEDGVRQPRFTLVAKGAEPVLLGAAADIDVLGARLQPAALGVLFDVPADALSGTLDLEGVLGREDRASLAVIGSTEDQRERMDRLEAWLLARLQRAACDDRLARRAVDLLEMDGIDGVSDALSVSSRQVERVFRRYVGMSPKAYGRVRRFRRALGMIEGGRNIADAVFACGYFDHAHLNRDFRQFARRPPSAYASGAEIDRAFVVSEFSKP